MNDRRHRNGRDEKRSGCGAESSEAMEARRHLVTTSRRRWGALRSGSIRDRKRGERIRVVAGFAGREDAIGEVGRSSSAELVRRVRFAR